MLAGEFTSEFTSVLEQLPHSLHSPDTALLKCQFDRTEQSFSSVVWTRGQHSQAIYAQTKTKSAVGLGYEKVIVEAGSQLAFSQEGTGGWSEAILTLHVDMCQYDNYTCFIIDNKGKTSESQLILRFTSELHTILSIGKMCLKMFCLSQNNHPFLLKIWLDTLLAIFKQ